MLLHRRLDVMTGVSPNLLGYSPGGWHGDKLVLVKRAVLVVVRETVSLTELILMELKEVLLKGYMRGLLVQDKRWRGGGLS